MYWNTGIGKWILEIKLHTYMRFGSDVILKYVFYLRKVGYISPFLFSVQKPDTQIPTLASK